MSAKTPSPQLRRFAVLGYSIHDEVLCHACLRSSTPLTGEKVSHVCRKSPRPVPDAVRKQVLELDRKKMSPSRIARELRVTLPTVMRVLSGDDADAPSCPACQAGARTENREIIPLLFADGTVHEEHCTYCGHKLLELAARAAAEYRPEYEVEQLTFPEGYPALRFSRRPPENVLQALKAAGWRWRARERVWADFSRKAEVPASVKLPPKPPVVRARPPVIRRRGGVPTLAVVQ